jgi:hypothetical protein
LHEAVVLTINGIAEGLKNTRKGQKITGQFPAGFNRLPL